MSTDQIYIGLVLTVGLAVGCQLIGARLRIPALILLLPVGFAAGAVTGDINPGNLLGASFQPLVSLAVAVILYDSGLGLNLRRLTGHTRTVVVRLIVFGVPITWAVAALVAEPLFGMSRSAAVMFGVILVVSGPTVVGPLLGFVRPKDRLRRILAWEGSLIDPIGGLLGAMVFHGVTASAQPSHVKQVAEFVWSLAVGAIGGLVGLAALWFLLRRMRLGEQMATSAQLAVVLVVAGLCDAAHDDTGLIAAVFMGLALANLRGFDMPVRQPFFEVLVQLIIGVLFISISATVTPGSLRSLIWPVLALVAVLILVVRPVVAAVSTLRTDLPAHERAFVGWMAPRGIVAAATASTFGATLVSQGIGGASKILPGTFLVIVATVTIYGLSASSVARRLRVVRQRVTRPLLVGGDPWAVDLADVMRGTGLEVVMWADRADQREAIRQRGIELAANDAILDATGSGAEIEGITEILILSDEHAFNVIAAALMEGGEDGRVYRIGSAEDTRDGAVAWTPEDILFTGALTGEYIAGEYAAGARFTVTADDAASDGQHLLFRVRANGDLAPVTIAAAPAPLPGDTVVHFGRPAPNR